MKKDGNGMENKIKVFEIRMFALSGMMRRKTGIFR